MRPAVRSLILFVTAWSFVAVGMFLFMAGFFSQWDGQAVSVRENDPAAAMVRVLVVQDDGTRFQIDWPREAIEGVRLSIDPLAHPPRTLPEGLPRTHKERWALSFTVTPDGGEERVVSTRTAGAFGAGFLVFVVGLLGRNMVVAGSPFSIEPRGVTLPKAQAPPGSVGGGGRPDSVRRGRKGPPPAKKRRGGGRRR